MEFGGVAKNFLLFLIPIDTSNILDIHKNLMKITQ